VRRAAAPLLLAAALAAALVQARSYDLWWHLETGLQILEHHAVPRADDYSFTSAGAPWVDHSWLFETVFYLLYLLGGPYGFTIMKTACAGGVAWIGYRTLTRPPGPGAPGVRAGPAMAVAAVALVGLRPRLAERPESVTLLMAAATAAILIGLVLRPASPSRRLAAAFLLTVLWANMHGGALLAPLLSGATAAAAAVAAIASRGEERSGQSAGLRNATAATLLTAAALPINPYGYRILLVPGRIAEALSPGNLSNPEWTRPAPGDFPLFYLAAAVMVALAVAGLVSRRPTSIAHAGLAAVGLGLALTSVRHIGVFFALMPLMIDPRHLSRAVSSSWRVAGAAVTLGAVAYMLLVAPPGAAVGTGVQPGRFPVKAADFIDKRMPRARLYNDVAFGGYLIWRGYPERRVFIDGRNEVHADLLRELSEAVDDGRRWTELLRRYAVEGAVVAYRDRLVPVRDAATGTASSAPFSELHFPARAWALVWWDDTAMVYVRRDGPYGALAAREYRSSRPEAWLLEGMPPVPAAGRPALEAEIGRKIAEDPECALAKRAAEVYGYGEPDAARPAP